MGQISLLGKEERYDKLVDQLESLDDTTEKAINADYFMKLVRKYTCIEELTAEIIREFVEKIIVHLDEVIDRRRQQKTTIVPLWGRAVTLRKGTMRIAVSSG